MGASPPTSTLPTRIWRVLRRGAAVWFGPIMDPAYDWRGGTGLLERVGGRFDDVEVETADGDEHEHHHHGVGDGHQLGDVGVVPLAFATADALVGGHRHVAAVERRQRDHVEDPHE